MNTYTWIISQMECRPEQEGYENVVFLIYWTRQAKNGNFVAAISGTQNVTFDLDGTFTPYFQLTFEQVSNWLESALGPERIAEIDDALDLRINNQINPPVVVLPIPWVEDV